MASNGGPLVDLTETPTLSHGVTSLEGDNAGTEHSQAAPSIGGETSNSASSPSSNSRKRKRHQKDGSAVPEDGAAALDTSHLPRTELRYQNDLQNSFSPQHHDSQVSFIGQQQSPPPPPGAPYGGGGIAMYRRRQRPGTVVIADPSYLGQEEEEEEEEPQAPEVFVISDEEEEEEGANDTGHDTETVKMHQPHVPSTPQGRLQDFVCPICFETPDIPSVTPCGHMFCETCLWCCLVSNARSTDTYGLCGICRKRVPYKKIIRIQIRTAKRLKAS